MNKNLLLSIGTIILSLGLAIQPIAANAQIRDVEFDVEPKDFLFETIIDIANNPNIKEYFEQKDNKYINNFNSKILIHKPLLRYPRVFFQILFTKSDLSIKYLNFVYDKGCKLVKIIGEEDTFKIIESNKFRNAENFEMINKIVNKNTELKEKITTITEMNKNLKSDSPLRPHPIICAILEIIFLPFILIGGFFFEFFSSFDDLFPLLSEFFLLFREINFSILNYFLVLLGCIYWPWYHI